MQAKVNKLELELEERKSERALEKENAKKLMHGVVEKCRRIDHARALQIQALQKEVRDKQQQCKSLSDHISRLCSVKGADDGQAGGGTGLTTVAAAAVDARLSSALDEKKVAMAKAESLSARLQSEIERNVRMKDEIGRLKKWKADAISSVYSSRVASHAVSPPKNGAIESSTTGVSNLIQANQERSPITARVGSERDTENSGTGTSILTSASLNTPHGVGKGTPYAFEKNSVLYELKKNDVYNEVKRYMWSKGKAASFSSSSSSSQAAAVAPTSSSKSARTQTKRVRTGRRIEKTKPKTSARFRF